jgi:uncharacterized protein (DUF362 family)/ferredoxin
MKKTDTNDSQKIGPLVSIVRLESYEPELVKEATIKVLEPLGGIEAFVRPGQNVVLKPNWLIPSRVEGAICTHPEVIRAVAGLAKRAGAGEVVATDSPAVTSAKRCATKLGIGEDEPFTVENADDGIDVAPPESGFHLLKLAKKMVEAEVLINLPKAKTHAQMVMTAAVKNTFGAVVGMEKAQWHYRAGRDIQAFARLLIHIHSLVKPSLNILDGVIAMEGNGPRSGTPRPLGILAASTDAHALDVVLADLFGLSIDRVYTLKLGRELGLTPALHEINIVGPPLDSLRPEPAWEMAHVMSLGNISRINWLTPVLDRIISIKPLVSKEKCTGCGQCKKSCAAGAITLQPIGKVAKKQELAVINTRDCISCFCCQEICPEGAITASAGPLARLMGLGLR